MKISNNKSGSFTAIYFMSLRVWYCREDMFLYVHVILEVFCNMKNDP